MYGMLEQSFINFKIYHFYKVLNQTLILEMEQVHELGTKLRFSVFYLWNSNTENI